MFYHGENDSLVPILSPEAMVRDLKAAGVETEFYKVPKAGHVEAYFDQGALDASIKFFDKHLAGK